MKKLFSMFCALAIILSVSAAPKKVAFNPEKAGLKKVMVTKQKPQLEAMPVAKQAVPGAMRVAKKVNEVVTIDLTATTDVDFDDYTTVAGEEWFQMQAEDDDYYFSLCINTDHLVGTFAPAEFDMDYTVLFDFELGDYVEFTSPITATVSGNDSIGYTFYAELNGTDGNEYHITMLYYEAPFVPTGDTILVDITEPMTYKYYASDGDWYLTGANNDYSVALDLVNNDSTSPAGLYTADDVLASYTNVTVKATNTKLTMEDLTAVVVDANNHYYVEAYMLCSDGNVYHINMFYAIPEALYFDTIVATNLDIEEEVVWFWTIYTATASNAGYKVELSLDADTTGIYEAAGTITPLNGMASKIYSGNINLTNNGGDYTITGTVLCNNNTEYALDLSFVMPTKTREVTFTCTDAMLTDYSATDGVWQLRGYNADSSKFVSVCIYSDQIAGTYTRADMYRTYTKAYEIINDSTDIEFKMLDANLVASVATNGDITVAGTLLFQNTEDATDVPEYTIAMTYIKPQASREVTVTIDDAELGDYTATNGVWQIRGFNAAGDLYVSVAAYADQLAGTYTTSMLYTDYTVAVTIVGADTTYFDAVDADFTVTVDASNNVVLAGDILFQNEANRADVPLFHLTMNSVVKTGLQYDSEDADFNINFPTYIVDDEYLQYGVLYVDVENDNGEFVGLEFWVADGATTLVDGTYTINSTQDPMTVTASTGVNASGKLTYSLAGYQTQTAYGFWFMVEGTVVINNGIITVNAKNSYDRTIKSVIGGGTGIEEVKAAENNGAEKLIRDGRLVIRHNGVEYNAQGATL